MLISALCAEALLMSPSFLASESDNSSVLIASVVELDYNRSLRATVRGMKDVLRELRVVD